MQKGKLIARTLWPATLCLNIFLGRILSLREWWTELDENIVLGALPLPGDPKKLADLGVRAVVNTCEEFPGPTKKYAELGIEQCHVGVVDYQPPTLEQIKQAVAFIETSVADQKKVYIHCKAGRGRSATMAMAWYIKTQNMTPQEAQDFLISKRHQVNRHLAERASVIAFHQEIVS